MRQLLAAEDVAARLGVTDAWMRRERRRLYDCGFPRPLPLPGIMRWDPAALDLWLDRFLAGHPEPGSRSPPAPPPRAGANDAAEEDPLAAILAARARAIAGGASAATGFATERTK